jgi:ankyrin repeat protein
MSDITELLGCVRRGDRPAVESLLAANPALANGRDDRGNSPLLVATYTGRQEIARVLLERGARPNFFGHRAAAEALLDAAADVRALSRNAEANLPINAAAAGPRADRRPEVVRLLLDRGSPVDGRGSPSAHTPLHEAAYNGDTALVRVLLERGADRSLRTGDGQTPLEIATQQGRHEVVQLLGGTSRA